MQIRKYVYIVTATTLYTFASVGLPLAGQETVKKFDTENIEIGISTDVKTPLVKIEMQQLELTVTAETAKTITELAAQKSKIKNATLVLSTDSAQLLTVAAKNKELLKEKFTGIPLDLNEGETVRKESRFTQLFKKFSKVGLDSARNDKVGVLILTYTTATESLIWIHSTGLSNFERTSNVIYSVGLAMVFGLNKDAWAQTTRPIQNFFRKILKPENLSRTNPKELATRFLGNFTLGALVTSVRIPLMSMDQIIDHGIRLEYFSMPLLLTVVTTSALFTWSEHLAMIDEKSHPITKFIFRRANEIRSIVIGTFATSAALLTPSQFGGTPWITMTSIGVAGALIYFNGETISKWLESSPLLQSLHIIKKKPTTVAILQCHQLFN